MNMLLLLLSSYIPSTPLLGIAEGQCRPSETGPAILVYVAGLKDRRGWLKLEVYPSNNHDFLSDDNLLIMAGKTFRRVDVPVPESGPAELCVRVPAPGAYSLSLVHDRDSNHHFGLSSDGIGFANNPRLGFSRPSAAAARVVAGPKLTSVTILMNYRRGLLFKPLRP
jgi:uncharacterized protein (DUF2141 family)